MDQVSKYLYEIGTYLPILLNCVSYTQKYILHLLIQVWKDDIADKMKEAGAEEHRIAMEKGHVDDDGIPYIDVSRWRMEQAFERAFVQC